MANFYKLTSLTCGVVLFASAHALALTLPSGSVITEDGDVVQASESPTTQKVVAQQGYAIIGQTIVVGGQEKGFHQLTIDEAKAIVRDSLNPELAEAFEGLDAEVMEAVKDAIASGEVTIDDLNKATEAFGADCVDPSNPCGITEEQLKEAGIGG